MIFRRSRMLCRRLVWIGITIPITMLLIRSMLGRSRAKVMLGVSFTMFNVQCSMSCNVLLSGFCFRTSGKRVGGSCVTGLRNAMGMSIYPGFLYWDWVIAGGAWLEVCEEYECR